MASLGGVSILCRSRAALINAASELGALCGLSPVLEEHADLVQARLPPFITFLHTPSLNWRWRGAAEQARMVCAHVIAPSSSISGTGTDVAIAREELLAALRHGGAPPPADDDKEPRAALSRFVKGLSTSFLSAAGRGRGIADAHVALAARAASSRSPPPPPAPAPLPAAHHALKEIVIGSASTASFHASEAALEHAGAARSSLSPSLWHFSGSGDAGTSPAFRLLPSRYSALVFRSPLPLPLMRETLLERWSRAPLAEVTRTIALYGQRRGDDSSGQLVVASAALAGLDLRFCGAEAHAPFFNMASADYDEDVDPVLNPGEGHPSKKVPMSCRSLVGMELGASVRRRLNG